MFTTLRLIYMFLRLALLSVCTEMSEVGLKIWYSVLKLCLLDLL